MVLIRSLKIMGERDFVTGSVEVLGDRKIVDAKRGEDGLKIVLDRKPDSDKPVCFKVEIT